MCSIRVCMSASILVYVRVYVTKNHFCSSIILDLTKNHFEFDDGCVFAVLDSMFLCESSEIYISDLLVALEFFSLFDMCVCVCGHVTVSSADM